MADSARTPLPPGEPKARGLATAGIVALVGRGMTAREILRLFPEFTPEDIRAALLQAADLVQDQDASLFAGDPVGKMIAEARQNSGLSEDEAMELAVEETRAARRERARR